MLLLSSRFPMNVATNIIVCSFGFSYITQIKKNNKSYKNGAGAALAFLIITFLTTLACGFFSFWFRVRENTIYDKLFWEDYVLLICSFINYVIIFALYVNKKHNLNVKEIVSKSELMNVSSFTENNIGEYTITFTDDTTETYPSGTIAVETSNSANSNTTYLLVSKKENKEYATNKALVAITGVFFCYWFISFVLEILILIDIINSDSITIGT